MVMRTWHTTIYYFYVQIILLYIGDKLSFIFYSLFTVMTIYTFLLCADINNFGNGMNVKMHQSLINRLVTWTHSNHTVLLTGTEARLNHPEREEPMSRLTSHSSQSFTNIPKLNSLAQKFLTGPLTHHR